MIVYLDVTPREGPLMEAVAAHVLAKWSARGVRLWKTGGELEEDSARLVVGNGQSKVLDGGAIRERVAIAPVGEADRDELLFRVDAKLGRLVRSDMAAQRRSLVRTGGAVSRRDLFLGLRHLYQVASGLPVRLAERCEAKYGCARCAEACPIDAIAINGIEVTVDEKRCEECGLCAAACPTAALQMPWFSEDSLLGLLDGADESAVGAKTLVLTCKRESVPVEPWMDVEEVHDVGAVGRQQLAVAASSSVGAVVVYCADGLCRGSKGAKEAAGAVSAALERQPSAGSGPGKVVAYVEGNATEEIVRLHRAAWPDQPPPSPRGTGWKGYAGAMNRLAPRGAPALGLGFTEARVGDACNLCGECAKSCPHGAFRLSRGELGFAPGECTGCGLCARVCPEGAIDLVPAGAETKFPMAVSTVRRDAVVTCRGCGKELGTRRFLEQVSGQASIDFENLRYCPGCSRKMSHENGARAASLGSR